MVKVNKYQGLADKLKSLRGNISVGDFAEKLGIKLATYYRYERGETPIKPGLLKLAEIISKEKTTKISDPEKPYDLHGGWKPRGLESLTGLDSRYKESFIQLLDIFSSSHESLKLATAANLKAFSDTVKQLDEAQVLLKNIDIKTSYFGPDRRSGEVAAILAHAPGHLVRAVLLSYYLGLRPGPGELFSLTWDDVNWDLLTITVRSAHKGGPQRRMVPIHKKLADQLTAWHRSDRKKRIRYIISYDGRPIMCIHRAWWAALKKAGITRRLRMYDLRHLFVTTALERGGDIHGVADVVGSKPDTIWKHYQHVTRALHRRTVALIPEMDPPAPAKTKRRKKGP
jgi:integrase